MEQPVEKPIGFIYITINKINNKKYIGQHTKFDDEYLGSGKLIQLAIKKYGKDNFERVILDYAYTQQELDEKEKYYISHCDAIKNRDFYNIHVGGRGGDTISGKTEEEKEQFKQKMSEVTKGKNNGMFGRKHSKQSKYKIKMNRNSQSPVFFSEEFKRKMSLVTSGSNNGMFGKKHSKQSKNKMSENSKGKTSGIKNGMFGKKGDKALNGKKIYQYADEKMKTLLKQFNSIQCVLKELNVKGHISLNKAIKTGSKYKGCYWSKERKM